MCSKIKILTSFEVMLAHNRAGGDGDFYNLMEGC